MSNFQNLFNPKTIEAPVTKNSDEYSVSFKEGKGGVYKSIVRFIPYYANPDKNIMKKITTYVTDPISGRGMLVDDPRTVGKFSPCTDMFFKFFNTKIDAFVQYGKKTFSTRTQYASLIQIIQDEQHPELVGQIKVLKYGQKIWDKIYAEEHPQIGEGINPFNPIYGRYFCITCIEKSGFNNYDQSTFLDNKNAAGQNLNGMWYKNPATNSFEVVTANTDQQAVFDYLASNSPDLSVYDYHPWTAEQEQFVNNVLSMSAEYLQTGKLQQNMATVNTAQPGGFASNPNPVFPGATLAAPATPATPATPAMPAMPQTPAGQMFNPAPTAPMPTPTPQAPAMSGLSIGNTSIGETPAVNPGQQMVQGVDIPQVEPSVVTPGISGMPSLGANIDSILQNI